MRVLSRALLLGALSLVAAGCSDDDFESPTSAGPAGRVRLIHASPDATPAFRLNLTIDDVAAASANFKGSTDYFLVTPGSHEAAVRKLPEETEQASTTIDVADGAEYSLVATGTGANIELLVLTDNAAPAAAGNIKLRVAHVAPTTGPLDVYITEPGEDLTTIDPTVEGLAYNEASAYVEVPAGAYSVRFTPAGTKTPSLTVAIPALASGQVRSVFAVESVDGTKLESIVVTDPVS